MLPFSLAIADLGTTPHRRLAERTAKPAPIEVGAAPLMQKSADREIVRGGTLTVRGGF
jgi:hypothetical protein